MFITTVVLAALLAVGFAAAAIPKILANDEAAANAQHVGFSVGAFRIIGLLEIAGAAGVLIGLLWAPLGVAAAAGLFLVSIGGLASHLRVKDRPKAAAPVVLFGVLAVSVLLLRLATA
ncbi:DoxX family protein [Streptomyces sp. NPDC005483]|uniref:DoxX family protein n=1 Tax=Streptomyces sp. NPDC005483 TaxID=3154882 RepID=UPI0033BBDD0E